ncbi:CPBP family intramembrane glutamic endopeptidase [Metabacillus fastidiosus]|uniref:CPBP family intramembrane metalloprotease n=1 Tax=Metabacillus fastidiosus TaxID=1458 RepID=A0ABU6NVF9_9BACI|nr:CPBP family intramembrane glutamic endopeptidase [Metabacillus fastidiosus]MED4400603.1 CPBP family intramembrane metalloprotease [Metabacillus fastidiosus]MED4464502.1 CPBP family intramembrane metalloprotease [Metabacillus fastidiosus]
MQEGKVENKLKQIITGLSGFLILDLYFNVTTHFLSNSILQFCCLLLFFPLASYIAKLNGLKGLSGIGLRRSSNSLKQFSISFLIGFGFWTLMYTVYWSLGKYEVIGIKTGLDAWITLIPILVGFFLGSLINDVITRGFIINLLKGRMNPFWIVSISIIVYAVDDFWNGDLTVFNFIFSVILGCSLTLSFYKTGSIWASTGIHFGLNTAYGLLYGLSGKHGGGLLLTAEGEISLFLNDFILLLSASLMLWPVFLYYSKQENKQ